MAQIYLTASLQAPCRLRQLTMKLEPHVMVRPWPKPVKPPPDERWSGPRAHYYLGIRKKAVTSTATTLSRAAAKNVNLNTQVSVRNRACPWGCEMQGRLQQAGCRHG